MGVPPSELISNIYKAGEGLTLLLLMNEKLSRLDVDLEYFVITFAILLSTAYGKQLKRVTTTNANKRGKYTYLQDCNVQEIRKQNTKRLKVKVKGGGREVSNTTLL